MSGAGPGALTRPFTERTAWARNLAAPVRNFLGTESGGAVALLCAAIAALVWANSPWWESYESVWNTELAIRLGSESISLPLREWISEGLMTFYFLVVGLEARREFDLGALRERRRILLLALTACGGMAMAVLIYLAFNAGGDGANGWGAAMSSDTAFGLGVLALVAPRATRLRLRLLSISVIDDLVALLVIATVYTEAVDVVALAVAVGLFAVLLALRYAPVAWRSQAAAVLGIGVWVALHESGVDPLISGLAAGLAIAAYPPPRTELERVTELARSFREQPTPELARSAQLGLTSAISANDRLEYRLHPWTSFVIVPLFALSNIGIHVEGELLADAVTSPITLGIVFGYVVGKPVGILLAAWLGSWLLRLQPTLSWPVIAAGGTVAGVPFTVSILIAGIAFDGRALEEAKLGVLAAAILAALLSWAVVRAIARVPKEVRARQLRGTADDLLDLTEDVDPERDHIRGPDSAPVTLVEYGDYECPYCGQAEVVIRQLLEEFGDELRYVWRHLPLNDVHPNAQMAAEATEAASAQGAFWPMHDKLLATQDELTPRDLKRHAEQLGLDVERLSEDLHRREYNERVSEDVASADSSGVAGTPSFFINGLRHRGAYDVDTLSAAVRAARKRARLREQAEPPAA
jgi:Na+/H+ antiporter NhaA